MIRQDVLTYAKEMDSLGDKVKMVARKMRIKPDQIKTMEAAQQAINKLQSCVNEYEECKIILLSLKVPHEIADDHKELAETVFQKQIDGSKLMWGSMRIINYDPKPGENAALVDIEKFEKGMKMLGDADNASVIITQRMIAKLGL